MNPVLFFIYIASILFCTSMALAYRKYLGKRKLTVLLIYLLLISIQETTLGILSLSKLFTNNAIVYNIYRPINVIAFAILYCSIPFMKSFRKLIVAITVIYLIITFGNYIFLESLYERNTYLTLIRGFVITFFAVLFLFRYFNLDDIAEEKYWRPHIWITIGVATFYPVTSISLSFQKYLSALEATLFGFKLYQAIPQVMSIFMYGCFSYAFYLCKRKKLIS